MKYILHMTMKYVTIEFKGGLSEAKAIVMEETDFQAFRAAYNSFRGTGEPKQAICVGRSIYAGEATEVTIRIDFEQVSSVSAGEVMESSDSLDEYFARFFKACSVSAMAHKNFGFSGFTEHTKNCVICKPINEEIFREKKRG